LMEGELAGHDLLGLGADLSLSLLHVSNGVGPGLYIAWIISNSGFHLATKIWGGSTINEWTYVACQVPWDVFL
jgi:hypothetical protein